MRLREFNPHKPAEFGDISSCEVVKTTIEAITPTRTRMAVTNVDLDFDAILACNT